MEENMSQSPDYSKSVFGIRENVCVHDDNTILSDSYNERIIHTTLRNPGLGPRRRCSDNSGVVMMKQWQRNSHVLLVFLPLFLFSFVDVTYCAGSLSPVFWNTSSSIFDNNNERSHVIDVHLGDTLDIFCPLYNKNTTIPQEQWEYYVIYMVDEENYNKCIINEPHKHFKIVNCSQPQSITKFTLLIYEFQPIPYVPEFKVDTEYYMTSTSRGSQFSMNNQFKGACEDNHMKITLRVKPHEHHNNNNNNNGGDNTRTTKPAGQSVTTPRSTANRRTASTTTTTTYSPKHITDKPIGGNNNGDGNNGGDDKGLPGTDGFPDDNTVIDASDGPEINTGVIDDKEDMNDNSSSTIVNIRLVNILPFISLVILLTHWMTRASR